MNNLALMRVRQRGERLTGKIDCPCRGDTAPLPFRERSLAEFHRDDEKAVNVARIQDRQNIWVIELGGDLHLVQELLITSVLARLWDLQRDTLLVNRIVGGVNVRKRAGRNPRDDFVLSDLLSRS